MARLTWTMVGVLLAVTLAGCGGFGNADDGGVGTSTPVPVPETSNETEAGPADVAPGLTTVDLDDPEALFCHHVEELRNTSVTAQRKVTREYLNGTGRSTSTKVVRSNATATRVRYVRMADTGTSRGVEQWIDDGRRYSAITRGNRTQYHVSPAPDTVAHNWWGYSRSFGRLLTRLPLTVDEPVVVNGTRVYPIQTTQRRDVGSLRDVSFTGRVSERGIVSEYTLSYVTVAGKVPVRVTIEFDISAVGQTTVERPEWVQRVEDGSERAPESLGGPVLPATRTDQTT